MRKSLTALFLCALTAASARATENIASPLSVHSHPAVELEPDPLLSVREVIHRTAEHEPGSAVVVARREQADAYRRSGRRLLAGPIALSASHINDGLWTDDGYRQWDAALELPLWWPGQRKGRQQSARAAGRATVPAQRAHLLEVGGWVREMIAELALARVRLKLAEAEWRAEDKLAAQVERAVALQELAQRDLLLAKSASLDRRFRYLEALEESRHAEAAYVLLTGLSSWPADWSEIPADHSAFQEHPLRLLSAADTALAQGKLTRLTGDQWGNPVLALGTQHERDSRAADFNHRIVAGVRIPIGRRSDAHAQVAAARRELAEAQRDALRLERELRGQLTHAEHRLALASARVSTATEQAEMAADYLRLAERGFALGEIDLGTLLRARSRSTAAQQRHREALILHRFSAAALNQALGVLP